MTRVAVLGAKGRMGSTSAEAIEAADGLELVARIDVDDDLATIEEAGAEAALVFTTPDVAFDQARWCLERGIHVVIGTSGFGDDKVGQLREIVADHDGVGAIVVPNFSIGAVLMMRFAAVAAPFFESVEVIEMHHPDKVDAPSGTAVRTAEVIAEARREAGSPGLPDATTTDPDGARGAKVAGIPVHAVRARGFIASQEVLLGDPGEIFSIRHDSSSRESFMPGVVAALRWIPGHPGVTVGLDEVLGLD
ncbi:4-hydroxy-tetrahydrodipicolinate reductase [Aeromicrobium sp. 636]|uniref:4-hydroxy-tetrahydrodipicolinate reductase n=1 Tax=Aeromicrobium senzhongii TaxID=2663859 RepID=A0A8I0ESK4_9ACTN|nr:MULTISPECIES: 4-hydroxy-tetrahydrodipicolinate reductase [Aeromicrobium]MBC9224779.1 4-hydroxy-tetrahydrodipicolinate reductase [Aeromicrobium senzhongii]MCQ3996892.1 4-hydroxy-tetrahydrodipicolinate reductase [Aeromicrobium sp. 636]MTB86825.1 4-hydroxy-tetrahydrodipicolinate reductase [Aeromicrobium senzhongii]QNL93336.1 4-hydroxy-tetrahydrodipicolinate reductase [Aeromicrobium senzhongii]